MSWLKKPIHLRNGFKNPERLSQIHELPCAICFVRRFKQVTRTIAHHKIGNGIGLKASDNLTMSLCEFHHNKGGKGNGVHETPLWEWEEKFFTQDELILLTDKMLEKMGYL